MVSTQVTEILERIKNIHEQKSHDYASDSNPFSNFEKMSVINSWFIDSTDRAFANMVGVKLARLAELLNGYKWDTKIPKNESIDDSFLDLCTYCVLWMAYHESKNN